jgi:RNA polymerase sigma factor (sigma-70 family)
MAAGSETTENAELLHRAARGDEAAWSELVTRYTNLLWSVARAHRLDTATAADVIQVTWLRLVERLGQINQPDRLGGWLATTASRESLRALRRLNREPPTWDDDTHLIPDGRPDLDSALVRAERDAALWSAFGGLSGTCQALLRLLFAEPPLSYREVSETLAMPISSIGPRRQRCLRQLRELAEARGVTAGAGGD